MVVNGHRWFIAFGELSSGEGLGYTAFAAFGSTGEDDFDDLNLLWGFELDLVSLDHYMCVKYMVRIDHNLKTVSY